MRVNNNVQKINAIPHKALHVRCENLYQYNKQDVSLCQRKLADTKFVDVIIDSQGLLAIKEKMTDVLQRIQSFSLFKEEQAIGINVDNGNEKTYKIKYDSYEEAKNSWKDLYETYYTKALEGYTKAALLLENFLDK